MKNYKSPLTIYVLWHSDFTVGEDIANSIYSTFCRNPNQPLSRGSNIPVFFRSKTAEKNIPRQIQFDDSDRNAVVILVDEHMFLDGDWKNYVRSLIESSDNATRFFPVAFSSYAYDFDEVNLGKFQFIQADRITGTDHEELFRQQWLLIRSRLLHDFSRQLLGLHAMSEATKDSSTDPPVKLFLSHAKKDGEELAIKFRDFIRSNTKLSTFFDVNDIADGHDFAQQISGNIDNSGVLVFHSDEYSNREWCRMEVITAKRVKAPIVIIHNIEKGENRSFPYLGNAPSIRWNNNISEVIDLMLSQVLHNLFTREKLKKEIALYDLDKRFQCIILCSPPELFNYLDIVKAKAHRQKVLVVYPDPPLGLEEIRVLNDLDENVDFVTPVMIPAQ